MNLREARNITIWEFLGIPIEDGEDFDSQHNINFSVNKDTLIGYYGNDTAIITPKGVTKIKAGAFSNNSRIKHVIVSSGVIEIEE